MVFDFSFKNLLIEIQIFFERKSNNVFRLYTEIIELYEKPMIPTCEQGFNVSGEVPEYDKANYGKSSFRAILDIGLLDCNPNYLTPTDENMTIIEASSDMLVLDLGDNKSGYKVGDLINFDLRYMGVLGIMNSDYVDKIVED